jgi:hypothetical protein
MNIEVNVTEVDLAAALEDDRYGDARTLGQAIAEEAAGMLLRHEPIRRQLEAMVRERLAPLVDQALAELGDPGSAVQAELTARIDAHLTEVMQAVIEREVGAAVVTYIHEQAANPGRLR